MDKFANYIDYLSVRHGRSKVFNDFLTIVVCCLSMGKQEELYFKTIKPYTREELETIAQAFAALVIEMDNKGEGLKDILGEYFEEYFHNEKLGQFFTPPDICRLIAEINPTNRNDVYDPCCGSGRLFLATAGINRTAIFYGADLSETCCKMTLINMCLNGLKNRISWMDSLTNEIFKEWVVTFTDYPRIPYILELEQDKQEPEHISNIEQKDIKPLIFRRFIA